MKKIIFKLIICSTIVTGSNLVLNSCAKVSEIIDEITIPIPFSIPLNFESPLPLVITNTTDFVRSLEVPMNIDLDAEIKKEYSNLSINNLKSARLNGFNIEYLSSDNGFKLDAIKNARIYIKTPNLPEKLIANAENNTSDTQITFVPVAGVNLMDYLKNQNKSLIFEIQGQKIAVDLLKVKINSSFRIELGL